MLGPVEGGDTSTSEKVRWSTEGSERIQLEEIWLRREETVAQGDWRRRARAPRGRIQKWGGGWRYRRAGWSGPMSVLSPLPSWSLETVWAESREQGGHLHLCCWCDHLPALALPLIRMVLTDPPLPYRTVNRKDGNEWCFWGPLSTLYPSAVLLSTWFLLKLRITIA